MTVSLKDAPAKGQSTPTVTGWKTILTHVEPGVATRLRVETAVSLAARCGAHLIGLGAELIEPVAMADAYGVGDSFVLTALREQVQENLKRSEKAFRELADPDQSEWRFVEDRPAQALARVSRAADVIVVGGVGERVSSMYRNADPAELALLSGRPVLVVPPSGGPLQANAVIIAWKDTREARRALADALPLLAVAKDVVVVEICDQQNADTAEFQAQEVADGLKRHGVKARAKAVQAPDAGVAEILNAEAAAVGADLIVAGCYGHSRANEWLFGGATRGLLHKPEQFLLLSH